MIRILQSTFIVGFFLVMMTLLMRDHIIPSFSRGSGIDVDHRILVDSWTNQDEWYEIRLGDMPLGGMRTVAERIVDTEEFTILGHLELRTPFLMGRLLTAAQLNERLEVNSARLVGGLGTMGQIPDAESLIDGTFSGEMIEVLALIRSQTINLKLQRGESVQFMTQPMPRPVTMIDSVTPILRGEMLSMGVVYSIDLYDPLMGGGAGRAEIEWVRSSTFVNNDGEEEELRHVEMRIGNLRTTLEVDENGDVLKREIPIMGPTGAGVGSDSGPRLVMIRRDGWEMQRDFPALNHLPETPSITPGDVVGESTGDVFEGVNLMSLLGRGLRGRLNLPGEGR